LLFAIKKQKVKIVDFFLSLQNQNFASLMSLPGGNENQSYGAKLALKTFNLKLVDIVVNKVPLIYT